MRLSTFYFYTKFTLPEYEALHIISDFLTNLQNMVWVFTKNQKFGPPEIFPNVPGVDLARGEKRSGARHVGLPLASEPWKNPGVG